MGELLTLPTRGRYTVCTPKYPTEAKDLRTYRLPDDALAPDGFPAGYRANVTTRESPEDGGLGAVRVGARVKVGYLHLTPDGGVVVYGSNAAVMSRHYAKGEHDIIGRVYSVCKSCVDGECGPVNELRGRGLHRPVRVGDILILNWSANADGFHVDTEEMRRWCARFGGSPEQWRGWNWTDFLHPDDRAEYVRRWDEAITTGKPYINCGRFKLGGAWRRLVVGANAVMDDAGQIVGWKGYIHLAAEARMSA